MKHLALYARVSTGGQTAETQLPALQEYAARAGHSAVEYVDEGISGKRDRRPALDAMMRACRKREVSAVVCVKLDRLGRSLRHLANAAEELDRLGVGLVVLDQAIDTSTSTGRLLFGVLASVAAFERELIVERTRAGLAAARRRGSRLGRPEVLDRASQERARRLFAHGMSVQRIAKMLGCSRGPVRRAVQRVVRKVGESAAGAPEPGAGA